MRLDKFLADMQLGSRKEVKALIKKGLIQVDGQTVRSDKTQIDETKAQVTFDGEVIAYQKYFYYMLNKPAGVISATVDNYEETVVDLLADEDFREDLFPVGRLDKDTEGFLLLSNDGALAHRILSPKRHVEKEYYAQVKGLLTAADVTAFAQGLIIDGGEETLPAQLTIVGLDEAAGTSEMRLILHEGKFHQVKRMVQAVGKEVTYLQRIRMGQVPLDPALALGAYRPLIKEEVQALEKA